MECGVLPDDAELTGQNKSSQLALGLFANESNRCGTSPKPGLAPPDGGCSSEAAVGHNTPVMRSSPEPCSN